MSGDVAFAPTADPDANELVRTDSLALLIGMLLDQQISIELAFTGPLRLSQRLSERGARFDASSIADIDIETLEAIFATKPALHRFPASMAKRTQALCVHLVDEHDGNADLWADGPTAKVLASRLGALPGFGDEKVKIMTALLGKRFGVRPRGWKTAAGAFCDREPRSVADMDSDDGRARVREWKKRQRAEGRTKQQ